MSEDKKEILRNKYLKIRYKISNRDIKNQLLENKVLNSPVFIRSKSILVYVNTEFEASTKKIIQKSWEMGKRVFAPFITDIDIGEVSNWKDFDKLKLNDELFLEPKEISLDYGKIDLCIIPAVAFDTKGYRLGYGSGWYDQFLADNTKIIKMGLGYDEQIAASLPHLDHDICLDFLCTPTKMLSFAN